MKKMLFVLTALALPLTAHAEEVQLAPKTMPEATIQATFEQFSSHICSNGGLQQLADAVYKCYLTTSENSPKIDQCMLGDFIMMSVARDINESSDKLGAENNIQNIKFASQASFEKRVTHYTKLPRFKNTQTVNYFRSPTNSLLAQFNDYCEKHAK